MFDMSMIRRMFAARPALRRCRPADSGRIYRELAESSDRVLAELGLARGDVETVSSGRYGCP